MKRFDNRTVIVTGGDRGMGASHTRGFNVLSPGLIETPALEQQSADSIARMVSTIPMSRMGASEEIAKAALFLASDDSSFVTGVELFVDGGWPQI